MDTKLLTIKNRRNLKLALRIDTPVNPTKLAFIAHGQGGFIGQKHIEAFAQAYLDNNYRVVRFDATHSIGDSEGDPRDVTYDSYVEDLEDVITWAKAQSWFKQPFALCGHSMGAQSTAWYAEHHPEEVSSLAPMAPPVNYELHTKVHSADYIERWRTTGYVENTSRSKPGVKFTVGWRCEESLRAYDLLPKASALTMPVLDIVGEFDKPCPITHQQLFIDAIGNKSNRLIQIDNAEHGYRDDKSGEFGNNLDQVSNLISTWLHDIQN